MKIDRSNLIKEDYETIANEPDRELFESHGFICEILRHHVTYTLCGYVYIPEGHKLYSVDGDETSLSVHGGITYSSYREGFWVMGFDCNHAGDHSPGIAALSGVSFKYDNVYRNWAYVKQETENLARQIGEIQPSVLEEDILAKLLLTME